MADKYVFVAAIVVGIVFLCFYWRNCKKHKIRIDPYSAFGVFAPSAGLAGGFILIASIFYPELRSLFNFDNYLFFGGIALVVFTFRGLYNDTIKPPESSEN